MAFSDFDDDFHFSHSERQFRNKNKFKKSGGFKNKASAQRKIKLQKIQEEELDDYTDEVLEDY
ncbi:MAG: hypothetical protein NZZ41_04650 [Candidatus Dojkabacteria bacterium]|nr:hypothetical protein [Candidatus Dojkabacteria bacterium]